MSIASVPTRRAIHLDFHTMPAVYDVGRDFDPGAFASTLADSGVDYVTVFAKCNLGFTYYPSRIGLPHPGLKKADLLGPMVEACHRRGIKVAAYFNAGIDHEHALRNRQWSKVRADGRVYAIEQKGHSFRGLCLNTGYRDYLLGLVGEVLEAYPVDGIFLDCFSLSPCYGVECLEGMEKLGLDKFDDRQAREYCRLVTERFMADAARLVRKRSRRPTQLYFNGMPYRQQPTHLELEILPTGGWGYESLPYAIRYARTLGKPYFTMTGRFHLGWGDFGGLRTFHSLLYDCCYSISNGGTCSIGDHLHPRGRLEPAVYDLVSRVYRKVRELEPWTEKASALTEAAILHPGLEHFPSPSAGFGPEELAAVKGATRMLRELQCQFDLVDGRAGLEKYRLLVLPDSVRLDPGLAAKLRAHLKRGGALVSSAFAGLNPAGTGFALKDYRFKYLGPEPHHYSFFKAVPAFRAGLPDLATTIYLPGVALEAGPGTAVLARLYKSYFNQQSWDGYHENLYLPPEQDTGRPALVRCGNLFHFSFPVFRGYYQQAVPAYRQLLKNCLAQLCPDPLVRVDGLPSFGQVTVTGQPGGRRLVHLLTYLPELRGPSIQMIEEPILARDLRLELRADGQRPVRVYLAPSGRELKWKPSGGYLSVQVPEVDGYQLVVFE